MLCRIDFRNNDRYDEPSYGASGAYGTAEPLVDTIPSPRY